jgi:golgi to ER traffic protein 4
VSFTPSTEKASDISPTSDITLNFLQFALITIPRAPTPSTSNTPSTKAAREAWIRLCGTYQARGGLLATPEYRKALHQIAHLYFGFPPVKTENLNPMGDLMASLFGGSGTTVSEWKLVDPVAESIGESVGLD